jgi:hypothetical protein
MLGLINAAVCLPLPVFWAVEVFQGSVNRPPGWTAWVFALLGNLGLVFLLISLWVAFDLGRVRFDLLSGRMTWPRLLGFRSPVCLQDVLAVQLAYVAGPRETFQVNLVFESPRPPRLNLLEDGDLDQTRRAGQHLARFLGVRVLDQMGAVVAMANSH